MKIHVLVQRDSQDPDACWVMDAVDEYTMDEWNGAYPDVFQQQIDADRKNRAVLIVEVPEDAMQRAFPEPPIVKGGVVE